MYRLASDGTAPRAPAVRAYDAHHRFLTVKKKRTIDANDRQQNNHLKNYNAGEWGMKKHFETRWPTVVGRIGTTDGPDPYL